MVLAVVFLGVFAAVVGWLIVYTLKRPKKPEHERQPEKFRDPAITAFKGPQGPGG